MSVLKVKQHSFETQYVARHTKHSLHPHHSFQHKNYRNHMVKYNLICYMIKSYTIRHLLYDRLIGMARQLSEISWATDSLLRFPHTQGSWCASSCAGWTATTFTTTGLALLVGSSRLESQHGGEHSAREWPVCSTKTACVTEKSPYEWWEGFTFKTTPRSHHLVMNFYHFMLILDVISACVTWSFKTIHYLFQSTTELKTNKFHNYIHEYII